MGVQPVGAASVKAMQSSRREIQQNQNRRAAQTERARKYVDGKLARNRQAVQARAKQNRQAVSNRIQVLTEEQAVPAFLAAAAIGVDLTI